MILPLRWVWPALLLLAPAAARAEDPLLARARALFEALKFDEAKVAYEYAASVRLATIEEVVAANVGLGLVAATLGDQASARAAFLKALAIRQDIALSGRDISPRQRAPFDAARKLAAGKLPPRIEHLPLALWLPDRPVVLRADVATDWMGLVAGVRLHFRRGQGGFQELLTTGKPPYEIVAPASPDGVFEYYLEAVDSHGCPVSRLAGSENPFRVEVKAEEGPPLYRRPWVWVAAAGVAAAVGAGIFAVNASRDPVYRVEVRTP